MNCVYCQSDQVVKNGSKTLKSTQAVQRYLCKTCGRRFNERSGTPMARLRTPTATIGELHRNNIPSTHLPIHPSTHPLPRTGTLFARRSLEMALNSRHEGLGVRAAARVVGTSPSTITDWEERLSTHLPAWSPPAPEGGEVTIEGDELYTRVAENLSPRSLPGMDD